jgi:phosphoglycolate phosphatase-like HAD superfamily hydrolase
MVPEPNCPPAWLAIGGRLAFDLDGTLIDARRRQVGVAAEALAWATGEALDGARFWRAKRGGATTSGALRALGYPAETADRVARRWAALIEADEWLDRDRPLGGVKRVVEVLCAAGAVITVLTARRRPSGAERSLQVCGLSAAVHELIVVDPGVAAAAKAQALRRCRASAFVGDTDSDGAASRAAGVPFAAVSTGQRSAAYLRARGYFVARSLGAALDGLAAGHQRTTRVS